jgi:hypothetical protein
VGKAEGKRTLGRLSGRWESNIKTNLREIEFGGMGLIPLACDREQWWLF